MWCSCRCYQPVSPCRFVDLLSLVKRLKVIAPRGRNVRNSERLSRGTVSSAFHSFMAFDVGERIQESYYYYQVGQKEEERNKE